MTLEEKLADAESAYHALLTGRQPTVIVDQNGERIEYNRASAGALLTYITGLRQQLQTPPTYAPMRIVM